MVWLYWVFVLCLISVVISLSFILVRSKSEVSSLKNTSDVNGKDNNTDKSQHVIIDKLNELMNLDISIREPKHIKWVLHVQVDEKMCTEEKFEYILRNLSHNTIYRDPGWAIITCGLPDYLLNVAKKHPVRFNIPEENLVNLKHISVDDSKIWIREKGICNIQWSDIRNEPEVIAYDVINQHIYPYDKDPIVTIVLPTYKRISGLWRMINCLANQDFDGSFEVIIINDGDTKTTNYLESNSFLNFVENQKQYQRYFRTFSWKRNFSGCGYKGMNFAISIGRGTYFMWVADDDWINSYHISNYVSSIKQHNTGIVGFRSNVYTPDGITIRKTEMKRSYIGHSEIIVNTSYLKRSHPHVNSDIHDWLCISDLINRLQCTWVIDNTKPPSYNVNRVRQGEEYWTTTKHKEHFEFSWWNHKAPKEYLMG